MYITLKTLLDSRIKEYNVSNIEDSLMDSRVKEYNVSNIKCPSCILE